VYICMSYGRKDSQVITYPSLPPSRGYNNNCAIGQLLPGNLVGGRTGQDAEGGVTGAGEGPRGGAGTSACLGSTIL